MKAIAKISAYFLAITIFIGCSYPVSAAYEAGMPNNAALSVTNLVQPISAEKAEKIVNPFTLNRSGEYWLYAYNAGSQGYTLLGYASGETKSNHKTEFEAVIKAVNTLPILEKINQHPTTSAKYGLMTVANDGKYTKVQYYLYKDMLTVNGTPYRINEQQYLTLKKAMEDGSKVQSAIPKWTVYMNPNRVVSISATGKNGAVQKIPQSNVLSAAKLLSSIYVKSAKTYKAGSKSFSNMPFRAVYTFDSNVTYTVWVSNVDTKAKDVTIYIESSDMSYGCEYVVDGSINHYIDATQANANGDINPGMGGA